MTPLLIQMSGAPGSGKSTLARAIAPRLHAAVLDHDLIKATLAEHIPVPAATTPAEPDTRPDQAAGRAAYALARRLAASLLGTGLTVILDSPCYYQEQLDAGQQIAARHHTDYRYVECVTDDLNLINARLAARTAYPTSTAAWTRHPQPRAPTRGREQRGGASGSPA